MGKDPRFATGPTMGDDIRNLWAAVKALQGNRGGFVASSASQKVTAQCGISGAAFALNGDTNYYIDTNLTVNVTPTVTSTLVCLVEGIFESSAIRSTALRGQLLMDSTAGTAMTAGWGADTVNGRQALALWDIFTGVTAAAHTVKIQFALNTGTDTINVRGRRLVVLCIPE